MPTETAPDTIADAAPDATAVSGAYQLDSSHSRIGFVARHAMISKVRGSFDDVEGHGVFDADDPTRSSIEVVIRAASVNTRNADRDNHLRGADFLDTDQHPEIRFVSSAVEPAGDATYRVHGELTIKGTTRPVTVDLELTGAATDPYGNHRVGLEGAATINRKDWGVSWNAALDAGGVLVGEKVQLEFDVSAIRS
jgi:polyisoprenoid-binding protein YceI